MSQQHMDFEESGRGYQAQAPYPGSREGMPVSDDAFSGVSGQKLGQYSFGMSASPGQRLALAIVSLCLLVPLAAIILGIATSFGSFGIIFGLIVMGLVCVTMMVVNIVFNLRH